MNTELRRVKQLVSTVLTHPTDFPWEVQGLGFMRLYLGDRTMRLHIWDSSIKVYQASAIHTHPWDLFSYVVAGRYKQHRYLEFPEKELAKNYSAVLYNKALIQTGHSAKVEEQTEVWLAELAMETKIEGESYQQTKNEIHQSLPEDGTCTLIDRTLYEEPDGHGRAASYWHGKGLWISAAPRFATVAEIKRVCKTSLEAWF